MQSIPSDKYSTTLVCDIKRNKGVKAHPNTVEITKVILLKDIGEQMCFLIYLILNS
jgi:hypothetical protein